MRTACVQCNLEFGQEHLALEPHTRVVTDSLDDTLEPAHSPFAVPDALIRENELQFVRWHHSR